MLNERLNPYWAYKKSHALEAKGSPNKKIGKHGSLPKRSMGMKLLAPLVDVSLLLSKPKLHNDSIEVLQELKRRHKTIVLFTNGAEYRVVRELDYLKIENYFEMIISAQDLNALKPNPLGIEVALKTIRASRKKAVYIGDMANDVIMAKYAGIGSCAMACGFDSYSTLKAARPDYIFRSMEEFKKAL